MSSKGLGAEKRAGATKSGGIGVSFLFSGEIRSS